VGRRIVGALQVPFGEAGIDFVPLVHVFSYGVSMQAGPGPVVVVSTVVRTLVLIDRREAGNAADGIAFKPVIGS
jgi:hypothetical protein